MKMLNKNTTLSYLAKFFGAVCAIAALPASASTYYNMCIYPIVDTNYTYHLVGNPNDASAKCFSFDGGHKTIADTNIAVFPKTPILLKVGGIDSCQNETSRYSTTAFFKAENKKTGDTKLIPAINCVFATRLASKNGETGRKGQCGFVEANPPSFRFFESGGYAEEACDSLVGSHTYSAYEADLTLAP